MPWAAAAVVVSAGIGYYSAEETRKSNEEASRKQAAATAAANKLIAEEKEQARADQDPWRTAGEKALQVIQDTPDFEFTAENFEQFKDPSYDFRIQEGVNALDRSAASRGRVLSGAQDRAVTRYGSNLASQEYGNAFNRSLGEYQQNLGKEQSLAGIGQTATNLTAQAGMASTGAIAQNTMSSAAAQNALSAQTAQSNAAMYGGVATSVNQGIGNYLLYQDLQKPATTTK